MGGAARIDGLKCGPGRTHDHRLGPAGRPPNHRRDLVQRSDLRGDVAESLLQKMAATGCTALHQPDRVRRFQVLAQHEYPEAGWVPAGL